jgi:hypothetical protein
MVGYFFIAHASHFEVYYNPHLSWHAVKDVKERVYAIDAFPIIFLD